MRALVQQTYERNKLDILEMQVEPRCCSDGREFFITQDYNACAGMPVIKAHGFTAPECSPRTALEVQQAHYGPRARKDPRIQLHLVWFPGQPPRIFAMQSSDTEVQEGLVRIARDIRDRRRVTSCEDETAAQKL